MDQNIFFGTLVRKPIAFAHDENKLCGHPHKSSQSSMKAITFVLLLGLICVQETVCVWFIPFKKGMDSLDYSW
jgi:hypothetical protein